MWNNQTEQKQPWVLFETISVADTYPEVLYLGDQNIVLLALNRKEPQKTVLKGHLRSGYWALLKLTEGKGQRPGF